MTRQPRQGRLPIEDKSEQARRGDVRGTGKVASVADRTTETIVPSAITEKCSFIYKRVIGTLLELKEKAQVKDSIDQNILQLISRSESLCHKEATAKSLMIEMSQHVKANSPQIGLILPISGKRSQQAEAILHGIRAAAQEKNINFEEKFAVKDSSGTLQGTQRALAELVLQNNVSMIITGLDELEVSVTDPVSKNLLLPMLILNSRADLIDSNPNSFLVFPLQSQMANSMVNILKAKRVSKVSILRPNNGKADRLINAIRKFCELEGISVSHDLSYIDGNFDSMETAAKIIAGVDMTSRKDDYDAASRLAKEKAETAGTTFNPRSIILPARLQSDALIIPDNFRVVRHFVNLLKYHGVEKLPLIGNHEWRSKELITPWEPLLDGAVFVDFVEEYNRLPAGIGEQIFASPFFIPGDQASQLDFRLIGYYTGNLAIKVPIQPGTRRRVIAGLIANLQATDGPNISHKVFGTDRASIWPTYHYQIHDGNLIQQNLLPAAP